MGKIYFVSRILCLGNKLHFIFSLKQIRQENSGINGTAVIPKSNHLLTTQMLFHISILQMLKGSQSSNLNSLYTVSKVRAKPGHEGQKHWAILEWCGEEEAFT